jgi:uncharacterized protein (TIGR02145 family)
MITQTIGSKLMMLIFLFTFLSSCTKIINTPPDPPITVHDTIIVVHNDTITIIVVHNDTIIIRPPVVTIKPSDIPIDIDGNVYDTVRIGSQTWMKENLKVTRLNDGTNISFPTYMDGNLNVNVWNELITPVYRWYNNDISNKDTYGAVYNWWAANSGKLCPTGWHVPSYDEWTILGTPYKNTGSVDLLEVGEISNSVVGTNTTGFTAKSGSDYWSFNDPDYMYSGFCWHFTIPVVHPHSPLEALTNPQNLLSVRCLKN